MSPSPLERSITARVTSMELDGNALRACFEPVRGAPIEIEDRIWLGPVGDVNAVHGVGRLLRILRSARVRIPDDPYHLISDPERVTQITQRCVGATVQLVVARRMERLLTLWTEDGVERVRGVIDYKEEGDELVVRRVGGQSLLRILKRTLIRYSPSSREYFEVKSIEVPSRFRLR